MSITLNLDIAMDSVVDGLDTEHIGPLNLTIDTGDDLVRKRVTLSATKWTTLDAGEVGTPWGWVLFNVGDDSIEVGFGQGVKMTLESGGLPGMWTGSSIPYAKGSSADSKLLYIAIIVIA